MAMNVFTYVSIVLITISIQTGRNLAIQIEINPETYDKVIHDEVTINCTSDGDDNVAKKIILMEILKDDKPIVVKHRGLKASFPNGNEKRFAASGHISRTGSISHLTITLVSYESGDSGQYSCVMYVVDETGLVKIEKSSSNLTEERLNIKTMENAMQFMKNKIGLLEGKCYTEAFSVHARSGFKANGGEIIVFPDVHTLLGHGYDNITGVFTAPIHGVYVFHLVVADGKHCGLIMTLFVSRKPMARVTAKQEHSFWDQSSISTVVELRPGDTVYLIPYDRGCEVAGSDYSMYMGYLLRAL